MSIVFSTTQPSYRPNFLSGLLYLILVVVTGCSTSSINQQSPKIIDTRPDGTHPSQTSSLIVPSELSIKSIDNKNRINFHDTKTREYKLTPGVHYVSLYYDKVWDLNANEQDAVKSKPYNLVFDFQSGAQYEIKLDLPQTHEEAIRLHKKPIKPILKLSNIDKLPSRSDTSSEYRASDKQVPTEQLQLSDNLSQLLFLWSNTNPIEKATFLKWIDQEKPIQ